MVTKIHPKNVQFKQVNVRDAQNLENKIVHLA